MGRRPLKIYKDTLAVILTGVFGVTLGSHQSMAAEPVFTAGLGDQVFYLLLFFLFTFCLILWMMNERKNIKRKLIKAQRKIIFQDRLLKSQGGVSLIWDAQGKLYSPDRVKKWFGIALKNQECGSLNFLDNPDIGFSHEQFVEFEQDKERLLSSGQAFRKQICLHYTKRNIVIKGFLLEEEGYKVGAVVWFRDATIDENITAFQAKDTRAIKDRFKFLEYNCNLIKFPIWLRDGNLNLIWVNQAYVDAVDGENADQVISEGLELVASSVGKTARDIARKAKELEESYTEKHFVVIGGERRAIEMHNTPTKIAQGQMGYLGYAKDITELEKARAELIHHTESHSETLNKLSTAVAIFTSAKRLEYYNSAFSRLWHLPENLLFSHPHHGVVLEAMRDARRLPEQANFPEWKAGQLEAYTQLMEPIEEMWHLPDNTSLRVVTQPHPLGGLLIFYEDVTDHFALERSYNTLFAVQRATLNNLKEGIAVFGIDGCLQLYNEAFVDIWSLERDMLDTNPHTMDVMDACVKNYGSSRQIIELKNLIVGGEMKKEVTSGQLKRRNGSVLNYLAAPLPDGAMLITFIDVSDSFTIERVLRQRNRALEEADKIKTDFLAHMSYELRTPLNSIIGFSELLEKEYQGPLNDVQHDYMRNILSASGQLLELFNDILDLSVIEAGGMSLDIERFEIFDAVGQAMEQLQDRVKAKDIDLVVNINQGLVPVSGDSRRIHHAIYNLLSNAVKFTPNMGHITLTISQDSLNYNIIITDTGVGIKPEEVDKVFEKFFTGSNVHDEQGAGLGLSLVASFVELHGGKLTLDSQLNVGTTITISLPNQTEKTGQLSLADE